MENHFNKQPLFALSLTRSTAVYLELLHNITLKDIILQIINSVKYMLTSPNAFTSPVE